MTLTSRYGLTSKTMTMCTLRTHGWLRSAWPRRLGSALIVLVFLASLNRTAFAQTEEEIKTSGEYYVGEAQGKNLQQVKEEALYNLIASIRVELSAAASQACGKGDHKSYAHLKLEGIHYLEEQQRKGHRVVAYVAKKTFLDATAKKVQCEVADAELREQMGDPASYLAYYKAYLRTFYSPAPIAYESPLMGETVCDIRSLLERRIRFFLANLTLQAGPLTVDPVLRDVITVPVSASYDGLPVSNVVVELDSPDGAPRRLVEGGTQLTLYGQPSVRRKALPVRLSMYAGEDNASPDLVAFHEQISLIEPRQLEVDYSNVITIDFDVEAGDSTLVFMPTIEGLSASVTEWDFGDGVTSSEFVAHHSFEQDSVYAVTLAINDSDALRVTKQVQADGMIHVPVPEPKPEAERVDEPVIADPATSPPPQPSREFEAPELPEAIASLLAIKDVQVLLRELNHYKAEGRLSLGNKADFVQPAQCYVFMVDPTTHAIVAVLTPGSLKRIDLLSGEAVADIAGVYAGLKGIWVQVSQ